MLDEASARINKALWLSIFNHAWIEAPQKVIKRYQI